MVFQKLLKKKGFSWPEYGEALLRRRKARYLETSQLPTTVPVSAAMTEHMRTLDQTPI